MNKTNDLIKTLEAFYDNNHSCMVGYLTGVLRELELDSERAAKIIAAHNRWIETGLDQ
jgi:hypothetical protein